MNVLSMSQDILGTIENLYFWRKIWLNEKQNDLIHRILKQCKCQSQSNDSNYNKSHYKKIFSEQKVPPNCNNPNFSSIAILSRRYCRTTCSNKISKV